MIKAVLWSRLAMMRGNIRNTHTRKFGGRRGFGVKHSWSWLQNIITQKRHPKDSCYIILDCSLDCYI